jgi:Holliday junction resolvasome RuvABC DNA-binding subunit
MTMTKSETIKIQDGENVIELTGADKEAFLEQRAKDQAETDAIKAETEARKEAKLSALQKLGLTEEEINAIL